MGLSVFYTGNLLFRKSHRKNINVFRNLYDDNIFYDIYYETAFEVLYNDFY